MTAAAEDGTAEAAGWPTVTAGFVQAWAERGGWGRWDRMQSWLAAHRGAFAAALLT